MIKIVLPCKVLVRIIVEPSKVVCAVEMIVEAASVWVCVRVAVSVDANCVDTSVEIIVVGAVCVRVAVFVDANCVDTSVKIIVVGAVWVWVSVAVFVDASCVEIIVVGCKDMAVIVTG